MTTMETTEPTTTGQKPSNLHELLQKNFGYSDFRFDQEEIIQSVLNGHDTLAIMPTGGGKSICYQLPALISEGITLVISPLISLMQDQVESLQQNGIDAGYLNSSLTPEEKSDLYRRVEQGKIKLLYVSPEGILSEYRSTFFKKLMINFIAIDEAHCVSQWGHEFRGDYRKLSRLKDMFPGIPLIALTATADERTRQDICDQLNLNQPEIYISGFDRPNIRYMIYERISEMNQLRQFIKENHQDETGIIYCLSRKKVDRVAEEMQQLGYNAIAYHAGMTSQQRSKAQRRFSREDGIIVVATIAFGMGIDRPDVRFVAHLDLPKSIEGYYQETGRAGRDGKPSSAFMVYGLGDVVKLSQMLETTDADEAYKKIARRKLDSMLSLCEISHCRRRDLLEYFGETAVQKQCNNCDACLEPPKSWDATIPVQKVLSTIYRTGQMFGSNHIVDVLRGSKNKKVTERGHEQLSVYGIGSDLPKETWNGIIRQLLYLNYIRIKDWDFRNLALTEKSRDVLRGESKLQLRQIRVKAGSTSKKSTSKASDVDHGRPELFETLRQKRLEIANEKGVPPYIVFGDKTLNEMCLLLPRNKSELLMVHGVGDSKVTQYGDEFIQLVVEYLAGVE